MKKTTNLRTLSSNRGINSLLVKREALTKLCTSLLVKFVGQIKPYLSKIKVYIDYSSI